jgi:hypothetical protein
MKQEECEEKLIIIRVVNDGIIQDQQEEDSDHAQQGGDECPREVVQPRAPEHIIVKSGEIVKYDPDKGKSESSSPEPGAQCNGDIDTEHLGFDLNLSEHIKENPGSGGSQKIKKYVEKSLVPVILHSMGRPLHI